MRETREITLEELDQELAEQLPARDLMGCYNSCGHPCGGAVTIAVYVNIGVCL